MKEHAHAIDVQTFDANGKEDKARISLYPVVLNPCELQQVEKFDSDDALNLIRKIQMAIADHARENSGTNVVTVAYAMNALLCFYEVPSLLESPTVAVNDDVTDDGIRRLLRDLFGTEGFVQ